MYLNQVTDISCKLVCVDSNSRVGGSLKLISVRDITVLYITACRWKESTTMSENIERVAHQNGVYLQQSYLVM